jgi:hypothetical protein
MQIALAQMQNKKNEVSKFEKLMEKEIKSDMEHVIRMKISRDIIVLENADALIADYSDYLVSKK